MKAGDRVRLKNDPGRDGVLGAETLERAGIVHRKVKLQGLTTYVAEDQLELLEHGQDDPLDLLREARLGHAAELRRALTHVRLTGRLANVIYSMDTTGTDFYAYQFKPVLKLLNSTSEGILIADEVGLGKTIEAGLIWTELRSRFDFRRLLVLCPAMLRDKWRDELRKRFGVAAEIADAKAVLAKLSQSSEEGRLSNFALVSSLEGLRPRKNWQVHEGGGRTNPASELALFLQTQQHEEPLVDLLVIDEAHHLRNRETVTATAGRLLRYVSNYTVLLSATPVHLKSNDLFALLNLLDEDTFTFGSTFDEILKANEPLVRALTSVSDGRATPESLSAELQNAAEEPILRGNRQIERLLQDLKLNPDLASPEVVSDLEGRLESVNLLSHVVSRTRKRDVTEWRVLREPVAEEIQLTLPELEFYTNVTNLVRSYCAKRSGFEGFLLVTPQRQMASSMAAALRYWQGLAGVSVDEAAESGAESLVEDQGYLESHEEEPAKSIGPLLSELVAKASALGDALALERGDSKYARLRTRLSQFFRDYPHEKIVLFSYFRATLEYLERRLRDDGISTLTLHGDIEDKWALLEEFRNRSVGTVLLSSEVGSEGVDLQTAWVVVNYDLPWNPMRVEQRIGRLDRLGQRAGAIRIWNLFCADTIDSRIYHRLYERLKIFELTVGSLEPVLGEKIQRLTTTLLTDQLSPEEETQRIEQTALALHNIRRHEEELENQAVQLVAYGDYILNQVKAARELHRRISGEDIFSYVTDFYGRFYTGSTFVQSTEDPTKCKVCLSVDAKNHLERFMNENRLEGMTRLTQGGSQLVECVFANRAVAERGQRGEIVGQFHPLVRFASHQLFQGGEWPAPAVSVRVSTDARPADCEPGIYVFAVQRWSIRGLQDIERLEFSLCTLGESSGITGETAERLIVTAATKGRDWPEARGKVDFGVAFHRVNNQCLVDLDTAFVRQTEALQAHNDDLAEVRSRVLKRHFEGQLRRMGEIRILHQQRGRDSLARATEGRMRALGERIKKREREIEENRRLKFQKVEICVGVLLVE